MSKKSLQVVPLFIFALTISSLIVRDKIGSVDHSGDIAILFAFPFFLNQFLLLICSTDTNNKNRSTIYLLMAVTLAQSLLFIFSCFKAY